MSSAAVDVFALHFIDCQRLWLLWFEFFTFSCEAEHESLLNKDVQMSRASSKNMFSFIYCILSHWVEILID